MGKLFVSLYFYIIISLFVLSGALEKFWPQQAGIDMMPLAPEFGVSIELLASSPEGLSKLLSQFHANQISSKEIAFLPNQQAQLDNGKAVALFDSQQRAVWYLKLNAEDLLKVGPYKAQQTSYDSIWPFFLMLALIGLPVAFWSYWLWRDFNKLQQACDTMQAPEDLSLSKQKRSLLLPITQTLLAMQSRIKQLLDAQRELTSSVSHEFRTPLARLKFAIAMLQDMDVSNKSTHYYDGMNKDINELESLVSEMLEFAKLESEAPSLDKATFDMTVAVEEIAEKLSFHSHIEIGLTSHQAQPFYGDKHFLQRAIQNLIGNACKYASKQVLIDISVIDQELQIKVMDDGEGIAKNEWENVFKPFTRLDKSRNKKIKGFGLGLAIVSKIVKWHDGHCFVTQGELSGACFVIALKK